MLLSTSFSGKSPKWEYRSNIGVRCLFCLVGVVFVIIKLFFICILYDHSFHNLKSSLHRGGIKRILNILNNLLNWSLIFFIFHLFFKVKSLHFFICIHICIKNLPLSGLKREISLNRGICLDTSFFQGKIESLT
jgi:hypothetical protein